MKFDMGATTLADLHTKSSGSNDDLAALVRLLVEAATPLEKNFSGQGRVAFDSFKSKTDEVCKELNSALSAIVGVQSDLDTTFKAGDRDLAANARSSSAGADFHGAKFSGK